MVEYKFKTHKFECEETRESVVRMLNYYNSLNPKTIETLRGSSSKWEKQVIIKIIQKDLKESEFPKGIIKEGIKYLRFRFL